MLNEHVFVPPVQGVVPNDPPRTIASVAETAVTDYAEAPSKAEAPASEAVFGFDSAERSGWKAAPPTKQTVPPIITVDDGKEPPHAQSGGIEVELDLALLSDYRRAGVSRSGENPVAQAALDVDFPHGWSVGAFVSTTDSKHSNVEVAFYGSKTWEVGDTEFHLGATAIMDVDENAYDFGIAQASVVHPIGPIDVTFAVNYAWEQAHLDDEDNLYVSLRGKSRIGRFFGAPLTIAASAGRMQGRFTDNEVHLDWSASATFDINGTDLGFSYVDNDRDDQRGDPAFVVSIAHTF